MRISAAHKRFCMSRKEKMSEEDKAKYRADDLPKMKNVFAYLYFCLIKLFFYLFFGVGAVFLAIFIFPFIRLFHPNKENFGIHARAYVSHTFRFFLNFLRVMGGSRQKTDNRTAYRNISGKVIIANHPSILDFVYIMSLVPNSTCIVRGSLTKTPLAGVIKQAYITNTTDFDDLCRICRKVIEEGSNVIIFPEGTRTPRHGRNSYKKGAARIALFSGCNVQPIFIGGSDKYGLGKHDAFISYNHVERYLYDFRLLPEIDIAEFRELPEAIAAKRLTEKMEQTILAAADEYSKNHPDCITLNNV